MFFGSGYLESYSSGCFSIIRVIREYLKNTRMIQILVEFAHLTNHDHNHYNRRHSRPRHHSNVFSANCASSTSFLFQMRSENIDFVDTEQVYLFVPMQLCWKKR